jgi:hypothetical protein
LKGYAKHKGRRGYAQVEKFVVAQGKCLKINRRESKETECIITCACLVILDYKYLTLSLRVTEAIEYAAMQHDACLAV